MTKTFLIKRTELEKINYKEEFLSAGRRDKIAKVKRDEDKELAACVELLLIYALKQASIDIVLPLDIVEDANGKLSFADDRIYFNFSHARDYAACTISDEPVGVDIEYFRVKEILNPDKMLHSDEATVYAFISNPNEKKKYFYECWVSKESFLKNLGIGLIVRPRDFMVNEEVFKIGETDLSNMKGHHKGDTYKTLSSPDKKPDELDNNLSLLEQRYVHIYQPGEVRGTDWKFDANYRIAVCTMQKDPEMTAREITAEDVNSIMQALFYNKIL